MTYTVMLEQAIAQARMAGFEKEADELETTCFRVAYTTSNELLGEHALAIRRFLKATRGRLPRPVKFKMEDCLMEADRLPSGWRKILLLLRKVGL